MFWYCASTYWKTTGSKGRVVATAITFMNAWGCSNIVAQAPGFLTGVLTDDKSMAAACLIYLTVAGGPTWVRTAALAVLAIVRVPGSNDACSNLLLQIARAYRETAVGMLSRMFESKQRLRDGAFIATLHSLTENPDGQEDNDQRVDDLMLKGTQMLRSIPFDNLSAELLAQSGGGDETFALSSPCKYGTIDFFISHSWSDDGSQKFAVLSAIAAQFERQHGRKPTFW